MKRIGNLWPRVLEWENLRVAASKALLGKRGRGDARVWLARMEDELTTLRERLAAVDVSPGPCRCFMIYDPKPRQIEAPCFADRVLHHALMNVLGPWLERWQAPQSYACRVGKGTHAALRAAAGFAATHGWFLQMDVRKYFESIPHGGVLAAVERNVKDREMLSALRQIVTAGGKDGHGLPLGTLVSQHLANFYLRRVDLFFLDRLRLSALVRYMDDWIVWSDDRAELETASQRVAETCRGLGLEVKAPVLQRTSHGATFLGHRVLPGRFILSRLARVRHRRAVRDLEAAWREGTMPESEIQRRAASLSAHAAQAACVAWRRGLMNLLGA